MRIYKWKPEVVEHRLIQSIDISARLTSVLSGMNSTLLCETSHDAFFLVMDYSDAIKFYIEKDQYDA